MEQAVKPYIITLFLLLLSIFRLLFTDISFKTNLIILEVSEGKCQCLWTLDNNKWHLLSDYPSVEKLLSDWLKKAYYRSSRKTNRALQDVWQKASRFAQLRLYHQNKTITGARKITIRGWRKTKELINNSSCFSYLCTMIGTYIVIPNQGP